MSVFWSQSGWGRSDFGATKGAPVQMCRRSLVAVARVSFSDNVFYHSLRLAPRSRDNSSSGTGLHLSDPIRIATSVM